MLYTYIKTFTPLILHSGSAQSFTEQNTPLVLLTVFSQSSCYLYCATTNTPPSEAAFNWQETATIKKLLLIPKTSGR